MSRYYSIGALNEKSNISADLIHLLELLEKVNPCFQEYESTEKNFIISYLLKLNLFNFKNIIPLRATVRVIGLPISVCLQGYFGDDDSAVRDVEKRKGLKIILNGDSPFKRGGRTLSTFIFKNNFSTFDEYLNSLRSPYRRRIKKALKYRERLIIRSIKPSEFTEEHYRLYLSVMKRTSNPLETLPINFFREYDAQLYEFIRSDTNTAAGFIQLKDVNVILYFLFGGFRKEDVYTCDIYYNMLLKIIEIGIEKRSPEIEFGQTAEESKLKIGCREKCKYMYVHHSNPLLNFIIQRLVPVFSYRTYSVKHHVFKNEE